MGEAAPSRTLGSSSLCINTLAAEIILRTSSCVNTALLLMQSSLISICIHLLATRPGDVTALGYSISNA
jgi:hypothetical protein